MIRIDHLTLPPGLDAIARRTGPGELYVVVSDGLDAGRQRAAVRAAVRAARRHAWEFGLLPLPLAAAAPALRGATRHVLRFLRTHAAVSAVAGSLAAGSVAATAAVFIVAVPQPHGHPAALGPNSHVSTRTTGHRPGAGARPGSSAGSQRGGTNPRVVTMATPKPSTSTPQPHPQPSPTTSSSSAPAKSPPPTTSTGTTSPSPQPTPTTGSSSSSGTCVIILGVKVCL